MPLAPTALPRHVGIIMDGNGRWARLQGLPRSEGHEKGAQAVRTVVREARNIGLQALTLFAFSSQNWDRPPEEVFRLMELLRRFLLQERSEILDNGIRLITLGQPERLPRPVREPLFELIEASSGNRDMVLCLALSYGGREAIAAAAQRACEAVQNGTLNPADVDTNTFAAYLPSSELLPPLDLMLRTSGEQRVSNFFLWEIAYAELYFTEKMWPEFSRDDLHAALAAYGRRQRRFGMTSEQLEPTEQGGDASTTSPAEVG